MTDIIEIKNKLAEIAWHEQPFPLLAEISRVCGENVERGRELVIRALNSREFLHSSYQAVLDEMAMLVGLHPYVKELEKLSLKRALQHAANRADGIMEEYVLHDAQSRVLNELLAGRSVILSAPTSFGKSLLIDAYISASEFDNVVIILPTLALVEETRRRMARFSDTYVIITTSGQAVGTKNIFVLTQERYISMRSEIPPPDFFVVDEFYKLSIQEDGGRSTQLNQAFLHLSSSGAQFYLLGPAISKIPSSVEQRANCVFLIENFQTVAIELHQVPKKPNKQEALANLIDRLDGQTMIYCQSPASTRKVLKSYLELKNPTLSTDVEIVEAAKWTADNYHADWLVSVALAHGIGIHHGRLPRALGRFMVRAFEEGKLKILLCTSTLIEGVNTSAKNVVIYDGKLNNKPLDFFTFNNIRGRSGRMFKHFVGHVYIFDAPPQPQLEYVDIPVLNPSENTPSSLLLQMPIEQLSGGVREKVEGVIRQNILPLEILKKHSSIEPEVMIECAKHLMNLPVQDLLMFSWSSRPKYGNIDAASEVIWNKLHGSSAARQSAVLSSRMMSYWIWELYKSKSVPVFRKNMIQSQLEKNGDADNAVENVLAFLRGWASYNYPKYLMAVSDIANVVLARRGLAGCNYIAFAASIEHLFEPTAFSSLEEYGLPVEISHKLVAKRIITRDDDLDRIVGRLKSQSFDNVVDNVFERRIVRDFQDGIISPPTRKKLPS
jgi:hypothetical protein